MNDFSVESDIERKRFKPVFVWIPLIASVVFIIVMLVLKFSEASLNGFASWSWVVAYIVIFLLVAFSVSLLIYFLISYKVKKPPVREFNGREFCDRTIRDELMRRTGYNLKDFSDTGDSIEGDGSFGRSGQDKVYYHLYRIVRNNRKRYILACMCMERGKEDDIIFVQSPMNFSNINVLINELGNRLSSTPERFTEREEVFRDDVTGRSETKRFKTPLQDVVDDEED